MYYRLAFFYIIFCCSAHQISVYLSLLLNQKTSYTNFDEYFLQQRTPQVLYIDSKILPLKCLVLFLNLSRIAWLRYIRSCNNGLRVCCKIVLLHSVLVLLFTRRSPSRNLLRWQLKENGTWLPYDEFSIIAFSSFHIFAKLVSP